MNKSFKNFPKTSTLIIPKCFRIIINYNRLQVNAFSGLFFHHNVLEKRSLKIVLEDIFYDKFLKTFFGINDKKINPCEFYCKFTHYFWNVCVLDKPKLALLGWKYIKEKFYIFAFSPSSLLLLLTITCREFHLIFRISQNIRKLKFFSRSAILFQQAKLFPSHTIETLENIP